MNSSHPCAALGHGVGNYHKRQTVRWAPSHQLANLQSLKGVLQKPGFTPNPCAIVLHRCMTSYIKIIPSSFSNALVQNYIYATSRLYCQLRLPQQTRLGNILTASFAFVQLVSDKSNAYKQRDWPHSRQCWTPPFSHTPQQSYIDNSAVMPHPARAGLHRYVYFSPGLLFC